LPWQGRFNRVARRRSIQEIDMAGFARGIVAAAVGLLWMAAPGQAAERIIVILDASGSMWGQIDGRPKQEIARQALRTALQSAPADAEIGFMAYGHREKDSCQDIELIVPPATGTAAAITSAADNLKFLGKTPLTSAVKQAADALQTSAGGSAKIVLITDGVESCKSDPCALGKELKASGSGPVVDVVGFGLDADEGRQVACLAEDTGGKYLQATDAEGLKQALAETVASPAATSTPSPAAAAEQKPGPEAKNPATEPEAPKAQTETPQAEPVTREVDFAPTAVLAQGGAPVTDDNIWQVYKALPDGSRGDLVTSQHGAYTGTLEPGDYVVVAQLGEVEAEQRLKIEAGQTYKPVFVLNAGVLDVRAPGAYQVEIVEARKDGQGNRKTFAGSYGETLEATLPAGDYVVIASQADGGKREMPASLKAGGRLELTVD
jgi:Ca-activated chloride channel family protein